VVSIVGVILLHSFQVSRTAVVFLELAEESAEKGKKAKADGDVESEQKAIFGQIKNLSWFFTLAPEDPRALKAMEDYGMLLAENLTSQQAYAGAVDTLSKVARRDDTNTKVKSKLIELYMMGGKFNEAREQIEKSLKKNPKDAEMLTNLGRCYAGMDKKKKEAKKAYLDAIKNDPHQVDAYFYFSLFLQANPEMGDVAAPTSEANGEEAATAEKKPENTPESLMAKMLEQNPKSAKAKVNMCYYLLSQKGTEENRKAALYYAEEALKIDPDNVETLSLAARCSLMNRNFEATRNYA
jgi:Flp pilus assembly protein TadD